MDHPLLVGVDIHQTTNYVCLLDAQGQAVGPRFRVANDRPGSQACAERLAQALQAGAFDGLRLAGEATNWYWLPFFEALAAAPALAPWPVELFALNPRLTAQYKETFSDLDKDDDTDSFVVADRLRLGRDLPPPFCPAGPYLALRFLTRYRYHLVGQLVRSKSYYRSLLFLKLSALRPGQPFSDLFGTSSQTVLTRFADAEALAACPLDELVALLQHSSRGNLRQPEATAQALLEVAQHAYPLNPAWRESVNQVLTRVAGEIAACQTRVKEVDALIPTAMLPLANPLLSIPGMGPVFSAGIIAELMGPERQSGAYQAEETPLTKRGNRYLRYYLCEAANSLRLHEPSYAAYYQRKYREVRKHPHERAVVLTARKLVRLVVRLLTTNQAYRPPRSPMP
jgi:transposase